jgi:hypothetical protein
MSPPGRSVAGVCETLAGLRQSLVAWAGRLDASRVTSTEAARLLAEAARIERAAAGLTVLLSERAARSQEWRDAGEPSPVHRLAREAGLPLGAAGARLAAGERMANQPRLAAAAAGGLLSAAQLTECSDAAASDPAAEGRLIDLAGRGSLGELKEECRRVRAAADRDADARRARVYARRSLRHYTDSEGVGHLNLLHTPETVAGLMSAVSPARDKLFAAARRAGRRERSDALDADALVATITAAARPTAGSTAAAAEAGGAGAHRPAAEPPPNGAGPAGESSSPSPGDPAGAALFDLHGAGPTGPDQGPLRLPAAAQVLVRVDFDALLRGYPIGGEVCEIAGYGPVAGSAVRDMIETGNALLIALATRGEKVTGVARVKRRPNAAQNAALAWSQPGCLVEGCSRVRRLERDHGIPWANRKITLLEDLRRLCSYHHDRKTRLGWDLVPGTGKRPFVPPTDPRHPRRRHPDQPSPPGPGQRPVPGDEGCAGDPGPGQRPVPGDEGCAGDGQRRPPTVPLPTSAAPP